jgi:hypothetical protein
VSRTPFLVALFLISAGALAACESTPDRSKAGGESRSVRTRAPATGPDAVRVFATGETRGHIKPCNCQQGQFGGLARRASFLAGIARPHDVLVDLGNAAAGTSPTRELRLETTLAALAGMDYRVFVPGELEAIIVDDLRAQVGRHGNLRIVTANLVRADGSRPFSGAEIVSLPDGRSVAIVGLTQPVRPLAAGWAFEPARRALQRVLGEIGSHVDGVIVASSLDAEDLRGVVAGLDVALVLSPAREADDRSASSSDFAIEGLDAATTQFTTVANFSTYVRCVDLDDSLRATRTWKTWLGEDVPGLPGTAELVKEHRARSTALHPTLVKDILRAKVDLGFTGSAVCAECHAEEYGSWKDSPHAHAMQTLVREGVSRNPDCVPCHLVDVPAGSLGADLRAEAADGLGVGCEACHGARAKHVETAKLGVVPPGGGPTWPARSVCTGCHRPPEVHDFDFEQAWMKIAHGRSPPR